MSEFSHVSLLAWVIASSIVLFMNGAILVKDLWQGAERAGGYWVLITSCFIVLSVSVFFGISELMSRFEMLDILLKQVCLNCGH